MGCSVRDWLKIERVNLLDFYPSFERDSMKPEAVLAFLDQ